jgi:hypothetical protein
MSDELARDRRCSPGLDVANGAEEVLADIPGAETTSGRAKWRHRVPNPGSRARDFYGAMHGEKRQVDQVNSNSWRSS